MKTELNGTTVNYRLEGPENGLPVVFIHAFPFALQQWDAQIDHLKDICRCLAYDVRGHGQSGTADGQYTIEFFVDDLLALMDHIGMKQAVVCGLSMGGYIALRLAEREPGRVKALVLCDTRAEADTNEGKVKRSESIRTVKEKGMETFAEAHLKFMFTEEGFTQKPEAVQKAREMIHRGNPVSISGTLLALAARTDTMQACRQLKVPVLCLVGEEDKVTTAEVMQKMASQIRGAEMHIIPQAAHLSNMENPEMFNRHIRTFLERIKI